MTGKLYILSAYCSVGDLFGVLDHLPLLEAFRFDFGIDDPAGFLFSCFKICIELIFKLMVQLLFYSSQLLLSCNITLLFIFPFGIITFNCVDFDVSSVDFIFDLNQLALHLDFFLDEIKPLIGLRRFVQLTYGDGLPADHLVYVRDLHLGLLGSLLVHNPIKMGLKLLELCLQDFLLGCGILDLLVQKKGLLDFFKLKLLSCRFRLARMVFMKTLASSFNLPVVDGFLSDLLLNDSV